MSQEENKDLVRRFVAAVDRLDFDQAMACLSPEMVVHMPGAPDPLNLAAFFQFGQMWHTAFPDEQSTFEDQIAEGDKVASRMTSVATHRGEFQGIPPTGRQIRVTGIWIDRIHDGKIVERWGVIDSMGVKQQLGFMPAAA